jgi:hypothetical protein
MYLLLRRIKANHIFRKEPILGEIVNTYVRAIRSTVFSSVEGREYSISAMQATITKLEAPVTRGNETGVNEIDDSLSLAIFH